MNVQVKTLLMGAVVVGGVALAGWSYYATHAIHNDLQASFCREMSDEKAYDKYKIAHYKMLIPGKGDWVFRSENDFRTDWHLEDRTVKYLQRLQDALKTHNADLVLVFTPARGMVHHDRIPASYKKKFGLKDNGAAWEGYETMLETLNKNGIPAVGARKAEVNERFFYSHDHHWTAEGAQMVAQNVAAVARKLPTYKAIPSVKFTTEQGPDESFKSSYAKGFEKICDSDIPDQVAQTYNTRPVEAASSENSLFETQNLPQVILLGTSNSVPETSHANFEGFLKEYLERDIYNNAFIGAGIDTSLMSYLNSPQYNDKRPKIIIWEIPGYYDLNVMDDKVFNQAIPAAYGSCDTDSLVDKTVENLRPGAKNELFQIETPTTNTTATESETTIADSEQEEGSAGMQDFLPEENSAHFSSLTGSFRNKYLSLKFTNPDIEKFNVLFFMDDGGTKKQQFQRSERSTDDGGFFTLFPQGKESGEIVGVALQTPDDFPSGVSVKAGICGL